MEISKETAWKIEDLYRRMYPKKVFMGIDQAIEEIDRDKKDFSIDILSEKVKRIESTLEKIDIDYEIYGIDEIYSILREIKL